MKITLTDVGKRFNRDWIFRHIHYEFTNGHSYAIIGPNGSGKSTLLQVIAGAVAESEGKVSFRFAVSGLQFSDSRLSTDKSRLISPDLFYQHISIAAPYLEVIEEMTLIEFLQFHQTFKPFITGMDIQKIISEIGLEKSSNKQIRYYSSGMKQRVKLAQAFFSDISVLLLDEPCTNLDKEGIILYNHLIKNYCADRIVIVSSNDLQEHSFCEKSINVMLFK
ncbi:MAG TPA: ATP-binding cassette domain-containing protein [Puia sp.]|nr:ATP-binding cassette domain-containing protein [Puia sp.]